MHFVAERLGDRSFESEGALWFADLTIPDPFFALPALSLGLAYASLEVIFGAPPQASASMPVDGTSQTGDDSLSPSPTPTPPTTTGPSSLMGPRFAALLQNGMQTLLIVSVPFAVTLPAGLHLLMAANSSWTIAYLAAVRHPRVYSFITSREMPQHSALQTRSANERSIVSDAKGSGGGSTGNSQNSIGPHDNVLRVETELRLAAAITAARAPHHAAAVPAIDSAAFLQQLPRLLYMDAVSSRREESALMRVLSSTLHSQMPLMHGHPNALLFQIAAGRPSAPWNVVSTRGAAGVTGGRPADIAAPRAQLAAAAAAAAASAVAAAAAEDAASAASIVAGSAQPAAGAASLAMSMREGFRTRWLSGVAVLAKSRAKGGYPLQPSVMYPGAVGHLALDTWRTSSSGRSAPASEAFGELQLRRTEGLGIEPLSRRSHRRMALTRAREGKSSAFARVADEIASIADIPVPSRTQVQGNALRFVRKYVSNPADRHGGRSSRWFVAVASRRRLPREVLELSRTSRRLLRLALPQQAAAANRSAGPGREGGARVADEFPIAASSRAALGRAATDSITDVEALADALRAFNNFHKSQPWLAALEARAAAARSSRASSGKAALTTPGGAGVRSGERMWLPFSANHAALVSGGASVGTEDPADAKAVVQTDAADSAWLERGMAAWRLK